MEKIFKLLVAGDVPEALELAEHEASLEYHLDHVRSAEELDHAIGSGDYALTLTAASLPDGLCGSTVVRTLKQHSPFHPVVMVADAADSDRVLEACKFGLDEHLMRCAKPDQTVNLLGWSVRRSLERVASRVSATSCNHDNVRAIEEKLERSETRFWEFFENLPVGIGILSQQGVWVRVNPVVEELLGYSKEELIGTSPGDYIHPDDLERAQAEIAAVRSGKQRVLKQQRRMIHRDGHILWTDVTAMALGGHDTLAEYFIGIITDITHRRQLENQLEQTERMRMIGQLAGGVAHDFNNLLTIITSYTHYVLLELGENSPQARPLHKVIQAAHRGSSLTDQLLAFSRTQFSRPKTLDLNHILEDTCEMLERLLRPQVELDVDLSHSSVPIWIDRSQLEQILFNLVINARDAMPSGGRVMIRTRLEEFDHARQVHRERIPPGTWGVLEVCDTGHGIAPEIIEHIFEPFFTTKEVGSGTGLGLASTWGVVKQAGGYIDVTSKVDEGTTFTLYFPKSAGQPKQEPHAQSRANQPKNPGATVLLVEDDDDVREALRRFLDHRGFHVLEASTGDEALGCAHERDEFIDILLTDLVMPGMNGDELADCISRQRPETSIFLMTGYAGARTRSLEERWELLPKPLDLDDLAQRLSETLD